jgi:hypothetical protein
MKAGKFVKMIAAALFIFISVPASASIITSDSSIVRTNETRVTELSQRLMEIKAMDRSALSRTEKKSLRKEVVNIKKEMNVLSGGVYISVGVLIIIILLLILLL